MLKILLSAGGSLLGGGEEHQGQVLQCLQVWWIINCFQHYLGNLELSITTVLYNHYLPRNRNCTNWKLFVATIFCHYYHYCHYCLLLLKQQHQHCQSSPNLDLLRKKLQEVPGIRCQGETRSRSCNGGADISTPFVNLEQKTKSDRVKFSMKSIARDKGAFLNSLVQDPKACLIIWQLEISPCTSETDFVVSVCDYFIHEYCQVRLRRIFGPSAFFDDIPIPTSMVHV